MRKALVFFIYFFSPISIYSQIAQIIPSSNAIAQTSVADSKNWQAFTNPSAIGSIDNLQVGFQYENRFAIDELSTKSAQVLVPSAIVNAGVSFSYFGYSQYHEFMTGLGFARNFSNKFLMGVQFNYFTVYLNASNSYRSALFPQIGLNVKLSRNFSIGFNSFNTFQATITTEYSIKRIPSIFSLGTEYNFSPEFVWRTQIDKEVSSNYRFATGFDYQMLNCLTVKLGAFGSDYLTPCIGVGIAAKQLNFNLNCELHPLLGLTTNAGICYQFNN